ncbi:MAG: iron-sulfur cluster assembly protein [bacterium]|jgi:iron-sulfur cluster assembly protein
MISLTENAAKEVRKVVEENKLSETTGIRIGIKGGGCAGFTYVFDFDDNSGEFDEVYDSEGLRVIVDRKSLLYIDGTVIDFNNGLTDRGFKFKNPKADSACGCGTSFVPKQTTLA